MDLVRGALEAAAAGGRIVWGGFLDGRLEGTVTLYLDTPPNQPFRAEIWKLMVAPAARGRSSSGAMGSPLAPSTRRADVSS